MAKRKISVKWNGKTIGTRTTDRNYTHALVLTDFDPAALRLMDVENWLKWGKGNARSGHAHAVEAKELTYRYASVTRDADRARFAEIAATPVETYISQEHAARLQRLEEHIARCISQGAAVLSYHQSRDLAFKAQATARTVHPEYLVLVEPVEAA